MKEVSIKVSDSERTYVHKFLNYDTNLSVSHEDAALKAMVDEAKNNFKGQPEEIIIKIKYIW